VDADNLSPVDDLQQQATLLAIAAHYPAKDRSTVRLIDNIVLQPATAGPVSQV
jgi:pantothenate synthetase